MLSSLQPGHRRRTILQHRYVIVVVESDVPNFGYRVKSGKDFDGPRRPRRWRLPRFGRRLTAIEAGLFADGCRKQAISHLIAKLGPQRGLRVRWGCYDTFQQNTSVYQLGRDLPDYAAAAWAARACAANRGRAVEVAGGIDYYAAYRSTTVTAAGEVVERGVCVPP
jgi:hypothetical protein